MTVKNRHTIKQLQSLAKAEKNKSLAVRLQAIVLAKRGLSCQQIVEMTGYCRRTIQRWVARYNQAGTEGLVNQPRSGRPSKLAVEQQAEFSARVDAGPKPSDGTATLYGRDIQQILEKELGVLYSLDGVYKLLHRLGYSCLKPRPRHEKADPAVQQAFKKASQTGWKPSLKSTLVNA